MGPGVAFVAIFLVFKGDSHELCDLGKVRVAVFDYFASAVTEQCVSESKGFGLSWIFGFDDLTGSSSEKESPDDEVDCMIMCVGVEQRRIFGCPLSAESAKKLRGDSFLSFWGRFNIVHCFEQRSYCGLQALGAVREVKGAALETQPKRLSQIACGCSDSRRRQGTRTWAKKFS